MPTGYTAPVQDGKITEFRDFAMLCARAFGALIEMRDAPMDASVPEAFEASTYNAEKMIEAHAEIERLQSMSDDEKAAAAQKSFDANAESWDCYEARKAASVARYQTMLSLVEAWSPPTPEHIGLKDFMASQLRDSIKFDGGPAYRKRPTLKSVDEWFSEALQEACNNLAYYTKANAEEIERVCQRNEWVRALRASLEPGGDPEVK